MKINNAGINLIKSFEQCRLEAYLPTPNDVPTIGWGHTGGDVLMGHTITIERANELFLHDLKEFEDGVMAAIGNCPTTNNQYAAMVSLAYNIGLEGFRRSSVLKCHRAGKYAEAQEAFHLWNRQAGKVLAGLVRRRKAEAILYGQ